MITTMISITITLNPRPEWNPVFLAIYGTAANDSL